MNKILISWLAHMHDFEKKEGQGLNVNEKGPTFSVHRNFYDGYEKHVILSSAKSSNNRAEFLENALRRSFPEHQIEVRYMAINDIIDLQEIQAKIQALLLELSLDYKIDIFFSPGTSIMQLTWMLCHRTLNLQTVLFQIREARFTKDNKPEKLIIDFDEGGTTTGALIKQTLASQQKTEVREDDFFKTDSIAKVYEMADKIGHAENVTVLIQGETGTGKEHLAHYIHRNSPRRNSVFLAVNCSAMGDQLLESELFGYKQGAFTGADKDKIGILEQAEGGTVFLDEIGDISPYMQQSLLRVLQEKEVRPVGGVTKKINVRFIAATNQDLHKRCEKGEFRWDLFYRLTVTELELPSLRERGLQERKELIDFFIRKKKKAFRAKKMIVLSKAVQDKLLSYPFPGNIRELENLIERFYVFHVESRVEVSDLPKRVLYPAREYSLLMRDVENAHIERVLRMTGFSVGKTAKLVGLAYNTVKGRIDNGDVYASENF